MIDLLTSQTADENHCDDGRLEVLVLDQPERLDPQIAPALPERRIRISDQTGKPDVVGFRAAVGRIFLQQKFLGRRLENLGLESSLDDSFVDLVDAVRVDLVGVDDDGSEIDIYDVKLNHFS